MSDNSALVLLSVVNWLHLAATVTWIGAMVTNIVVLMPAAKQSLEPPVMGRLFGSFMRRFRPLVYTCILTLFGTGIVMMLLNRHYKGALQFGNPWSQLLLVKHVLIIGLIVMVVYAFEVLAPKVGRLAAAGPSPKLAQLQKFQQRIGMVGLIIASIILLITGVITAVSALP